jgi:hypothetical protein
LATFTRRPTSGSGEKKMVVGSGGRVVVMVDHGGQAELERLQIL